MKTLKSYKFRIYPNKTQEILLAKTFGCVRFSWNSWVEAFNKKEQEKSVKELRQQYDWIKEVSSTILNQKQNDFNETKRQFFSKTRNKKINRPKFKKKGCKESFRQQYPHYNKEIHKIQIAKIGWIKVIDHQEIPNDVKLLSITVSKDSCRDYYASILVEQEVQELPKTRNTIGIDVGLKEFVTTSDKLQIKNPRYFRKSQSNLARAQRHLSRKVKGSNRYHRQRLKVARINRKIARQREWFLHNVSKWLVTNYDVICLENLNVEGMKRNHCLAKSISDAAFANLRRMTEYKSKWYGKTTLKVDRFYPSSKICNKCGQKKENLTLTDRIFVCDNCGNVEDRDYNASKNIRDEAMGVNVAQRAWRECQTEVDLSTLAVPYEMLNASCI